MRRMKKLLAVMLLAVVASLGAPPAFADGPGGIEMPGKTVATPGGPGGGIEMPGCATPGDLSISNISVTISIIVSTLI